MDVEAPRGLLRVFGDVEDPRVERTKLHLLPDILVITLCAVICGADTWMEIELFGQAKRDWLRTFLELPHGIPSHDTFGRVFALLVALSMLLGRRQSPPSLRYRDYFIRYAYALLPIALFYHIAHNMEHLLMEAPTSSAGLSSATSRPSGIRSFSLAWRRPRR